MFGTLKNIYIIFSQWYRMGDTGGTSQKYPGITSPISLAEPKPLDLELSKKVEEAMMPHGTFETDQELAKR